MLAAYTALGLANRITVGVDGRWYWLVGSGAAMGVGIWAMHFLGMLAFSLPIPMGYDIGLTAFSLGIAVACSTFAFWVVCRQTLPWGRLMLSALLMGLGIASMHYVGMAAMRMSPAIEYAPVPYVGSYVIAIVASAVALWLLHRLRHDRPSERLYRLAAAAVMGLAVCGMHYLGMAAAQFPLGTVCMASNTGLSSGWMATSVTIASLGVLAIASVVAVLDARLESRTSALATSLATANRELIQLALHDTLTKLPNRILLEERLSQALDDAREKPNCFAVIFLDLDGFKAVNDAYGHEVGDALLIEMARRARATLRARDSIARLGGDEFVALVQLSHPAEAAEVAQRLIDTLSRPADVQGHYLVVTASAGIAVHPSDGTDARTLLKNADAAMYHAKRIGRPGFSFFEPSMNAGAQETLQLIQDLRQARERGELELYYQPKFVAPNGPVTGAEALLRWRHPVRGLIAPAVFIPLAERTGQIVPIGEWVIDEACRQLRVWRDAGRRSWRIAVNLSAMQFSHVGLVDSVREALERQGLPGEALILEVTESTAMRDVQASLEVLQRLVALGVAISIDDFGTGYSSLLYLKRLPATELKIDRGFVQQLDNDSEDAAIVSAIIALGQRLNLKVVAEGVETREQQAFLTDLGCDALQGFLLGEPMPVADFDEAHLVDTPAAPPPPVSAPPLPPAMPMMPA
nr:EAL domain-containing protein [Verticiella sp. GG226]